jgi:hypothetical protein
MSKQRRTVTLDEAVLRAVRVKAARTGRRDSEVIEEPLRRDLGLELLERIWAKANLGEAEALTLAVEEQHTARRSSALATRLPRQPRTAPGVVAGGSASRCQGVRSPLCQQGQIGQLPGR